MKKLILTALLLTGLAFGFGKANAQEAKAEVDSARAKFKAGVEQIYQEYPFLKNTSYVNNPSENLNSWTQKIEETRRKEWNGWSDSLIAKGFEWECGADEFAKKWCGITAINYQQKMDDSLPAEKNAMLLDTAANYARLSDENELMLVIRGRDAIGKYSNSTMRKNKMNWMDSLDIVINGLDSLGCNDRAKWYKVRKLMLK